MKGTIHFLENIAPCKVEKMIFLCKSSLDDNQLHSLKLTWHLQGSLSNRKIIFQSSIFRGYVSFRECNLCSQTTSTTPKMHAACWPFRASRQYSEQTLLSHSCRAKKINLPSPKKQVFDCWTLKIRSFLKRKTEFLQSHHWFIFRRLVFGGWLVTG